MKFREGEFGSKKKKTFLAGKVLNKIQLFFKLFITNNLT